MSACRLPAAWSLLDSAVAIPRKLKKPATSVTVVRMIDDDCTGSWLSEVGAIGMTAPARPAATIAITIDTAVPVRWQGDVPGTAAG